MNKTKTEEIVKKMVDKMWARFSELSEAKKLSGDELKELVRLRNALRVVASQ
jgi:hypothetical protein